MSKSPFGPTGKYPEGKLSQDDQGELAFGITKKDNKIIISFGISVEWIGMLPEQAIELGNVLIKKAEEILKEK